MPAFLSLILYRFELNLRSASILGLIGAGGIGTPLIFAIQTRSWDRVGIILIGFSTNGRNCRFNFRFNPKTYSLTLNQDTPE